MLIASVMWAVRYWRRMKHDERVVDAEARILEQIARALSKGDAKLVKELTPIAVGIAHGAQGERDAAGPYGHTVAGWCILRARWCFSVALEETKDAFEGGSGAQRLMLQASAASSLHPVFVTWACPD